MSSVPNSSTSHTSDVPTGKTGKRKRRTSRESLRLEIDPVIARAASIVDLVEKELPTHPGLARIAKCIEQVATDAKEVASRLRRPFGLHRLPAYFLTVSLFVFACWLYWQFFHTPQLLVAIPERDAVQLAKAFGPEKGLSATYTVGSQESLQKLSKGQVHAAFIQGGVEFSEDFPHLELDQSEVVLLFLREPLQSTAEIRKILTSAADQGSHSLAKVFTRVWGIDDRVQYIHDWRLFTDDANYQVPDDVDAVFAVKDPMSSSLDGVAARLLKHGFRLVSPDIGAMELRLKFLRSYEIRAGYLDPTAHLPGEPVSSYAVMTYLVASPDLTPHQWAMVRQLVDAAPGSSILAEPSLDSASEVVQGLEAVFGVMVYIGLAFLALLGLDVIGYRRRFHELNTLVSLISMHQSSKDVLVGSQHVKAHHVAYLSVCSDLLGIIAVITSYYTQENSSMLMNRLSDIIHERCSGLKINIQLKILHAMIELPESQEIRNLTSDHPLPITNMAEASD